MYRNNNRWKYIQKKHKQIIQGHTERIETLLNLLQWY